MRIKHKVNVQIASDADMYNLLFAPDDTRSEVVIDAFARMASGLVKVAATTNEDLPLGDVTAIKGIFLKVDQECEVKLNGGTEIIQLRKPTTSSTVYARLFLEADISQVNINVPGADDLEGVYCVWGDTA